MTLLQLRYLVAIVDAGLNISTAARRLQATQPSLSKQLRQIEDELGFQVFLRRGKSLDALTAAGAPIIERARVILTEAANIEALAANVRQGDWGELRIATTHTQARFVLPPTLAAVKNRFPDLVLKLMLSGEAEALALIEQDGADIAIFSRPERPATEDLVLPLYRWDLIAAGRRGSAPPLTGDLALEDLAQTPLVTYDSALEPQASFARAFAAAGLTPTLACTARDADLIKTYVRAGLGLGVLAEMAATEEDADMAWARLDGLPTQTAWAVLRRDRVLRNPVLELLDDLAPHLGREALRGALDVPPREQSWPEPPRWASLRGSPVLDWADAVPLHLVAPPTGRPQKATLIRP